MGRRRCCCPECLLFSDDFNRANSTNLGSRWTEASGDWSISSNQLKEAGTSGALLWCTTEATDAEVVAQVTAKSISAGNIFRLIICAEDADKYFWGELEADTLDYTIRVGTRSGGSDTLLEEWTSDQPAASTEDLCLAFNGTTVTFSIREAPGDGVWGCASDTGYRKAGLINGSAQQTLWDDYELWRHYVRDPTCPYCICTCFDECPPKQLLATFTATGDCADELDGVTMLLDRVEDPGGSGYDTKWKGGEQLCNSYGWQVYHWWDLLVKCEPGTNLWRLNKNETAGSPAGSDQCTYSDAAAGSGWPDGASEAGWAWGKYPSSAVCEPFEMVYGPFSVYEDTAFGSCDCCALEDDRIPSGTYTITITEAP